MMRVSHRHAAGCTYRSNASLERFGDHAARQWFHLRIGDEICSEPHDHHVLFAIDVKKLSSPTALRKLAFVANHVPFVNLWEHSVFVGFFAATAKNSLHHCI